MPIGPDGWFEGGKAIKVEGGIKARSRARPIGEQWWSRRFIDILEGICDKGRLERGPRVRPRGPGARPRPRAAAAVSARVQGSRDRAVPGQGHDPGVRRRSLDPGRAGAGASRRCTGRSCSPARCRPRSSTVFDDLGLPLFPDASST